MSKPELILVAVEDQQNQHLLVEALEGASYRVIIANDKETLNRVLQNSTPTLVILNQEFRRFDGILLADEFLDRFPTIPVLLLVTHDAEETVQKAIHIGISDCLLIPLERTDILNAVTNSIRRANRLGDWTRREVRRTTASLQQQVDELGRFESILNHIEEGVIILDEKLNILLMNHVVRRAFGMKDEEVLGKPFNEVFSHPDLCNMISNESNSPSPHVEIIFDDGRVLSAQYALIPKVGSAITLQDISYFKQMDRLKNEFVSAVSHDLRSPLTAILGYIELLERVGPVNDKQRLFVTHVKESVHNITLLVNDLMDLGRLEGGLDGQNELVDLGYILQLSMENVKDQIQEKQIISKVLLPEKVPPIRGNPIRLRQLLDNLIGNAVKYTPNGEKIQVDVEVQSEQLILKISDTGLGIPAPDQAHIFDKFYRASNVPKGVGGSGIGLAIVKSIVNNHGGRIWVDSVLGQGSSFTVVLPLASR